MRLKDNKGDASFKIMLVSVTVFLILSAALYSRLDIQKIRRESGQTMPAENTKTVEAAESTKTVEASAENTETAKAPAGDLKAAEAVAAASGEKTDAVSSVEETQQKLFYLDRLKPEEKTVYWQIYDAVTTRTEKTLSTLDEELADRMFQLVLWDHPEIFDTGGYQMARHTVNDVVKELSISAVYEMTPEQKAANQKQIDQYVDTFMASVPAGLDTYGKIKYVFDYIVSHTEYELDSPNSQNICSVMIGHKSVCSGYAKATQYLLLKLSIPATIVHGKVGAEGHAWNLVYVDGKPYYLDTTWGDSSYSFREQEETSNHQRPEANYDYFLITDGELRMTHTVEHPEYYPPAVFTENNYYKREGKYFESYDMDQFKACVDQAYEQGKTTLTIRAANEALFLELQQKLIEQQEVFNYLRGVESLYYSLNENMKTMTFWL